MSLDAAISSLPKELGPFLNKIVGKPVVLTQTTSNNIAKDNSLQICGPVAGHIEYVVNLHYHAGGSDTCWKLSGDNFIAAGPSNFEPAREVRSASGVIEEFREEPKLLTNSELPSPMKAGTRQIHLHSPEKGRMPVLATTDPTIEGNWIASRIVTRLKLKHQEASTKVNVPSYKGKSFSSTRIFVELSCGNFEAGRQYRYRFYVVNHCKAFDLLFGNMKY